jgi:hypothetical protein
LDYLLEVDVRRLYATKAYSSLFEYLVKDLGFSEPAAVERVNTVRLMREVPVVKTHLQEGRLSLTTASQIERFIKTENKVRRSSHSPKNSQPTASEKIKIVEACLDQSKREVEKTLFQNYSNEAKIVIQEKVKRVDAHRMALRLTISEETFQKLQKLKELAGEKSLEFIFDQGLDLLLLKEQKKRGVVNGKNVSKTQSFTSSPQLAEFENTESFNPLHAFHRAHSNMSQSESVKNCINPHSRFQRSGGRCEYVDPKTKKRCQSRYRVQVDHVHPFALGGKTEFSNLRHLC